LLYLYPLVFFLLGVSLATVNWSYTHYILDIAPPKDRASYVGLANTLGGLLVLAPVLGGALLDATSYGVLFGVTLAFALAALAVSARLPDELPELASA
jgi:MFS family permease